MESRLATADSRCFQALPDRDNTGSFQLCASNAAKILLGAGRSSANGVPLSFVHFSGMF